MFLSISTVLSDERCGPLTSCFFLFSFKDNFLKAVIYYEDLNFKEITEEPLYDVCIKYSTSLKLITSDLNVLCAPKFSSILSVTFVEF